jgi:hypothetical protein
MVRGGVQVPCGDLSGRGIDLPKRDLTRASTGRKGTPKPAQKVCNGGVEPG